MACLEQESRQKDLLEIKDGKAKLELDLGGSAVPYKGDGILFYEQWY